MVEILQCLTFIAHHYTYIYASVCMRKVSLFHVYAYMKYETDYYYGPSSFYLNVYSKKFEKAKKTNTFFFFFQKAIQFFIFLKYIIKYRMILDSKKFKNLFMKTK